MRSLLAFALSAAVALPASAFDTAARAAYVIDLPSGTVLMDKNGEQPLPPASMSKLMTIYMLFEALKEGRVSMDTTFGVSARAAAMGGSSMFLTERDRPTVQQLIRGIIVQSGNDATVVVAEGLAGSENAFARQMTETAHDLGMNDSTFANASGWPDPDHRMSMHDLAILARHLIEDFPDLYSYFSEETFDFDGRVPSNSNNRNPLLGLGIGADGLKTGHTEEAGYGLVGSAVDGDRRVIFALSGMASENERRDESERVVNWAFRQFVQRDIAKAGETLAEAEVWLGDTPTVPLVAAEDVTLLLSAIAADETEAEIVYNGPLAAPIEAGTPVGELVVQRADLPEHRIPVLAGADVGGANLLSKATVAAQRLAGDLMDQAGF